MPHAPDSRRTRARQAPQSSLLTIRKRFRDSAHFFPDEHAFNEWAEEVSDEGIGVALHATDWEPDRAKDKSEEALFGLKVWFAYMKARDVAKRDLRGEARYQKACQASPLSTQVDNLDESLTKLDIKRAFPDLSPDQCAAHRAKRGRPRKDQAKRSQTGDEPPLSSRECI